MFLSIKMRLEFYKLKSNFKFKQADETISEMSADRWISPLDASSIIITKSAVRATAMT